MQHIWFLFSILLTLTWRISSVYVPGWQNPRRSPNCQRQKPQKRIDSPAQWSPQIGTVEINVLVCLEREDYNLVLFKEIRDDN